MSINLQVYKYSAYIKRTRITHLKWIILDFIKMLYITHMVITF